MSGQWTTQKKADTQEHPNKHELPELSVCTELWFSKAGHVTFHRDMLLNRDMETGRRQ